MLGFEWKIGKFENVWIFKHYKILIMVSKKERNGLKETENKKNAEIAWIAYDRNVSYYKKINSFVQISQTFGQPQPN